MCFEFDFFNNIVKEKEPRKIADDEISCLKTQIRDAKDEIEEMSITLSEKTEQLQDYRLKVGSKKFK